MDGNTIAMYVKTDKKNFELVLHGNIWICRLLWDALFNNYC